MKIRRSIRLSIYVLCGLLLLYSAAWYLIADRLDDRIVRWADDRRADGWTVKHGDVKLGGYPFAWRASIATPEVGQFGRDPQFQWSGPAIVLAWKPWKPDAVGFEATDLHRLEWTTDRKRLAASVNLTRGAGELVFGPRGTLHKIDLLIDGAALEPEGKDPMLINRLRATVDMAPASDESKPTEPHQIPSVRLDADVFGLTLPKGTRTPLGRTVGRLTVRGAVMGRIPRGRPAVALSRWQNDGGTVEIAHLELGWAALVVRAGGTMALDSALQPIAAMTGQVSGYGETLDALVTANVVKPGAAMVAKFALGALSRTSASSGRSEIEVSLSIQDGWLFVGPVKLAKLPTIRWH